MDKFIEKIHENSYVPAIEKMEFYLTLVCILGTDNCGKNMSGVSK